MIMPSKFHFLHSSLRLKFGTSKLLAQLEKLPLSKRPQVQRGPKPMHETHWSSLSLRINQPYWFLHQGNCEHFLIVDQIRSSHPSDTPSGYPLTAQLTPTLLPLCRSCTKVPAVWSIVGDIRLGESPCVLCAPCWRCMGMPGEEDGVLVVPLSKHEFAL
jgi:snRNA-activating protein complex subunit 3